MKHNVVPGSEELTVALFQYGAPVYPGYGLGSVGAPSCTRHPYFEPGLRGAFGRLNRSLPLPGAGSGVYTGSIVRFPEQNNTERARTDGRTNECCL